MLGEVAKDLSGHSLYIAGNPDFVDACVDAGRALGAADERIFVERYTPQSPPVTASADRLTAN